MSWRTIAMSVATVVAAGQLHVAPAHAGDVSVGVSIGVPVPPPAPVVVAPPQVVVPTPPPPVAIAAPPQVILVPGSPVYYAPSVDFNLFVYSGRYYRLHQGAWFTAASHRGPWKHVVRERVPQHVLAVPVTYYRIPPGHAKKMEGRRFGDHGKGKRGKHDSGARQRTVRGGLGMSRATFTVAAIPILPAATEMCSAARIRSYRESPRATESEAS